MTRYPSHAQCYEHEIKGPVDDCHRRDTRD